MLSIGEQSGLLKLAKKKVNEIRLGSKIEFHIVSDAQFRIGTSNGNFVEAGWSILVKLVQRLCRFVQDNEKGKDEQKHSSKNKPFYL